MSIDGLENDVCGECQFCCKGHLCRVLVTEEEKSLFPTVDFSNNQLTDGRSFFDHPCPHIGEQGCGIYKDRPKDCEAFKCNTLARLSSGQISKEEALKNSENLKKDISQLMQELKIENTNIRGFRQIALDWIAQGKHKTQPVQSREILSILKRLDKDFFDQFCEIDELQSQLLTTEHGLKTPAYVVDDLSLDGLFSGVQDVVGDCGAKILYSVKANGVAPVLERLSPLVDGFSCSSVPEVELVRRVVGDTGKLHFVGPSISPTDVETLYRECENISYNSLSHFERYGVSKGGGCGLRVNPHLSLSRDQRYDPCRPYSKLGISIYALKKILQETPERLSQVDGLHFHNATGNNDLKNLVATVNVVESALPDLMKRISWINLGGGYRLHTCKNAHIFRDTVKALKNKYNITVYIEPGTALVAESCWLVSSVIDVFESEGRKVAILDTSINHQLESFIYEFPANLRNSIKNGKYIYEIAGSSCLAGDLFGQHAFAKPLEIGSRIVYANVGAYTHAFTTRYNGLNPPSIYQLQANQKLKLRRHFDTDDFAIACAV